MNRSLCLLVIIAVGCNSQPTKTEEKIKQPDLSKTVLKTNKKRGTDFNVEFLYEPRMETLISEIKGIGKVELITLGAKDQMFSYHAVPPDFCTSQTEIDAFCLGKIHFVLNDFGINGAHPELSTKIENVKIVSQKFIGKEFSVQKEGVTVLSGRVFLIDNTSYFLMTIGTSGVESENTFLNSFQVL